MNEKIEKISKHETKSLDELAVMLALGASLDKVDRGGRFYTFYLSSTSIDLEEISLKLASKSLEINAAELLSAYKRAKSISHSTSHEQRYPRSY